MLQLEHALPKNRADALCLAREALGPRGVVLDTLLLVPRMREVRGSRDRIMFLEKISGRQDVARRLAHEIKNPLTPIQLAFQQLEARATERRPAKTRSSRGSSPRLARSLVRTSPQLAEEADLDVERGSGPCPSRSTVPSCAAC